jgi:hypothetical protein
MVMTSHPNFVQMITWNDYPEGTEFAPSSGSQFLFYDLSAYYIQWYKSGRPPPITRDAIYYSHRTQIFDPAKIRTPGDQPYKFGGETPVQNNVEMVALLTAPARLQIELNGRRAERDVGAACRFSACRRAPGAQSSASCATATRSSRRQAIGRSTLIRPYWRCVGHNNDNSINVQVRASLQARDQIVLIPGSLPPNTCVYEFASTRKFV